MEPAASDPALEVERVPWWRYAVAAALGLSILGLTYVLFDPDLGTQAPLFGEFTCRGGIIVEVANGFHEPYLTPPNSAVYFRAHDAANNSIDAFVTIETREGDDGEWTKLLARSAPEGDGYTFIPLVTEKTQARVLAKDTTGQVCAGVSRTITASASPAAEPSSP